MDRSIIDRDNVLERFVMGQLPDDELDAFLAYQTLHPEIRAEVEAVRAVIKSARAGAAGAASPPKTAGRRPYLWWLFLLVGCFLVGWWYWNRSVRQANTPIVPERPALETPPVVPSQPDQAAQQQAEGLPLRSPDSRTPRPIAARLRPNPRLEALLGPSQYRDNGEGHVQWIQEPPREQHLLLEKNRLNFTVSASVQATAVVAGNLQCLLFSNAPADYEAFQPLLVIPVAVQERSEQTFLLVFKATAVLNPGLYYYLIEDRDSGEPCFIGKLIVR